MTDAHGPQPLRWVAGGLLLAALALSVYLTVLSIDATAVAGCGEGSGCGEVFGSRWSKIAGVPTSAIGSLVYAMLIAGLVLSGRGGWASRLGVHLLTIGGWSVLLAAVYYAAVQVVAIRAICPLCMTAHALGLVIGVLVLRTAIRRATIKPAAVSLVIAISGLAVLHLGHARTPSTIQPRRIDNPFADRDGDKWIDGVRYVGVFGGELQFALQDVPYLGEPDAERIVAVLFDYACPHCKTLHGLLERAIEDDPSRFVFVPLPMSIYVDDNPHASSTNPRFEGSYDLAMLSLAVGVIDREAWKRFDRWLFAMDGGTFPRGVDDARTKAEALVGVEALGEQFIGENRDRIMARVQRHIDLIGLLPDDQRYIPVTTTPGAPEHLTTRFDDIAVLIDLLDAAETASE